MSATGRAAGAGRRGGRPVAAALAAGALLALLVAGCGRTAPPAAERLRFIRQHATKTYGDCAGGTDRCTRITLRWPLVAAAPSVAARESITAFVRATLFRPYDGGDPLPDEDSVMIGFIQAYHAFVTGAVGGGAAPWWFERRIEPLGDTLGVASLAVTERSFLGGAHPNSTTLFTNVDLATGRTLRRADLLAEGGRDSLDARGERAFRRVRGLKPDEDLALAGFRFEQGRFRLNDNLAVTRTGLLFFFNDYEIAPHALGVTELALSWAEVRDLVRPDGPLGQARR